ncbi:NusG domain II-containing protein [Zoogloea oleivorans]|uniref:NusG domain II-containing protein n=1 Tax=Zoogloea oleivorans TaxID=1552750 RepID=A0A6C2CK01_9RHOO|nr:NusG domain II-containing protein [Zoogloea sp.]MBT9495907.1 NusG domain II-containing protein [Zoogloea sp.]TYC54327.1 NusG domain II-containing protein [Zoogloea oleivorans]
MKAGDVLVLGCALLVCVLSAISLWKGGRPDKAIIKSGGKVFAEVDLSMPRIVEVPGPLGTTRVEIQPGRARVAADPGPRQYCVRQGWLSSAGAVAICAPNQVSLALSGRTADYDSLNY